MPLPAQKLPVKRTQPSTDGSKSAVSDPRFASLQTDPRYRLPSRKHTHVKLDKRFASILKNDEFSRKASVDRYGRKIENGAGRKELERLYELESGDEDEEVEKELKRVGDADVKEKYDPAREGGFSESSSSEEDNDDEDDVEEAELYPQARDTEVPMGEVSRRIAVVNMDWDNIRSADIMAVAGSFVPEGGRIERVVVYPSEFGRERMDREELEGPPREIFTNENRRSGAANADEQSDEEEERIRKELLQEDKGEEFNSTALRRYQIDRLRYYYAVITCSSTNVAAALYDALDGREYLSSANFFDLRFIPDDVEFDESPRDSCEEVVDGYKPTEFVTDALNHSKVKLTWDLDDGKRKQVQKRAFSRKEIDENDLQAYIGSASSSDEDEEEELEALESGAVDVDVMSTMSKPSRADRRDALRAALGLASEPEKKTKHKEREVPVGNMQISFTPGISASDEKRPVFENEPIVEETTREKYVRKERERKAKRKEKAKARREGRDPDDALEDEGQEAAEDEVDVDAAADGFDDPFFDDPSAASAAAAKKSRKEIKAKRRKEKAAEEATNKSKRAELEHLMDDEKNIRHFDMKDIVKAEKQKKRQKKNKGRRAEDGKEEKDGHDGFQMNVKDPRFSRLFESHEFAIDPTNPRFKGTEGMKALLEEGRQKRKLVEDKEAGDSGLVKKVKATESGQDVSLLVAKLKRKSK